MVDLGTYAFEVLMSYATTFVLLALLVLVSLRRARKVRTALEAVEAERDRNG